MSIVRLMDHGQVTIPKRFREALGLSKGDLAEATLDGDRIVITPKKLVKDKVWRELLSVMDKVHKMNEGVSEEEVTQDVLKAIAELREEECEGFPIVKPIKCDGILASELLIKDRK